MSSSAGLGVPDFPFASPLASKAMELERLRGDLPTVTDALPVVLELAQLYRLLSSIVSARIEGNHTTIADAVAGAQKRTIDARIAVSDSVEEILHLQDAAAFVDAHVTPGTPLSHALIREIHRITVRDLDREGDATPGSYRRAEVAIAHSSHRPPLASTVHAEMSALLDFANEPAPPHFQLIRMAIAHHRFVWIHPFGNGNGRTARLFSYAMIRAYGFAPDVEYQTVNPTTVFGADRPTYYARLASADSLEDDALLDWADFVLDGLLRDMRAMHTLVQPPNLTALIHNAIDRARESALISDLDARALTAVCDGHSFKAGELREAVGMDPSGRSRLIGSLRERLLIRPVQKNGRVYRIQLSPNVLTPAVFAELDAMGLLPSILADDLHAPPNGQAGGVASDHDRREP